MKEEEPASSHQQGVAAILITTIPVFALGAAIHAILGVAAPMIFAGVWLAGRKMSDRDV